MRVELRLELDQHEYAIDIECDQSVLPGQVVQTAVAALERLTSLQENQQ